MKVLTYSLFGTLLSVSLLPAQAPPPLDLDSGNAVVQVIIPNVIPVVRQDVSPGAGDATLVLRTTTVLLTGMFDALAPYHPSAVGIYSRLGRRPAGESATNRNKNIAVVYASYRVLSSLYPRRVQTWRAMVESAGLDPDNDSQDLTTPEGIGNVAGLTVMAYRERDGMNQLGDEGGRDFNGQPYADYTGYEPFNTAYQLRDPSRWQPAVRTNGTGLFQVQQFVTPQLRLTKPYTYNNPNMFHVPPPIKSRPTGPNGRQMYKQQADEVLEYSANLTDRQKMTAEFFDDKFRSLGFSALFILQSRGLDLDEFVHYDLVVNIAAFDAAISTWNQKRRWDAVRPFSAIRFLYGNRTVRAWGGPGKGTVDLPADQWTSYLPVADHPEYPSGSACFCAAHGEASRRYLGSNSFGWSVPAPAGSSWIEPGVTPATDITLGPWDTWSDFEADCGMSRVWGGVHFVDAVTASEEMCAPIGGMAYDFLMEHVSGTAAFPPAPPSQ